jgi:predicted GNAT family acetyltransferase
MTDETTLVDDPAHHRFDLRQGDTTVAFITYRDRPGGVVELVHTEVVPAGRGHGYGGRLAGSVLALLRDRGVSVLPSCPFLRDYLAAHPDQVDLVPADQRERFGL